MTFKDELVLLGTKGGPSVRNIGVSTMPTSSLLDLGGKRCVIDCGLGVTRAIVESGRAVNSITHVFLTHYHSDHIIELGGLLHTAWASGLDHTVHVFGPEGLEAVWGGFCQMLSFDIALRQADEGRPDLTQLVQLHTFAEGVVLQEEGVTVQALKVLHPPVEEAYAFRFDCGSKAVTFSGDTTYFPPLAEFAKGSSILVHEAMLAEGIDFVVKATGNTDGRLRKHLCASHCLAGDAGKIARAAEVGKLVLHHLVPPERDVAPDAAWLREAGREFSREVVVSFDGLKISF